MKTLQILINGKTPTEYLHNGDRFVEGREGSKFSLKIYNPNYRRVKAIVSVDGLSVIDGEPASDNSKGYLINGFTSLDIDGWQISDTQRKEFVFKGIGNSYNSKTGNDTRNVGVIAVKLFQEKMVYNWPSYTYTIPASYTTLDVMPLSYNASLNSGPLNVYGSGTGGTSSIMRSMAATASEPVALASAEPLAVNNIGAGMGNTMYRPVQDVEFNAESYASTVETIFYDDIRGLEKRGIDVKRVNHRPNPFPGNPGYCKVV